jgi:CCR4-NOT transcriptional regulation complex NOT5 subunit
MHINKDKLMGSDEMDKDKSRKNSKPKSDAKHRDVEPRDNATIPHNANKESLGPNTKR